VIGSMNRAMSAAQTGGWWENLSPRWRIAVYVAFFLGFVIVANLIIQDSERTNPRKCPKCGGPLTKRDLGESKLNIGGRTAVSQTDLIEWACDNCGWKTQRGHPLPGRPQAIPAPPPAGEAQNHL